MGQAGSDGGRAGVGRDRTKGQAEAAAGAGLLEPLDPEVPLLGAPPLDEPSPEEPLPAAVVLPEEPAPSPLPEPGDADEEERLSVR